VLFLWEVLEIFTIPLVTFPDIDHASELPRNHSSYCVAICNMAARNHRSPTRSNHILCSLHIMLFFKINRFT